MKRVLQICLIAHRRNLSCIIIGNPLVDDAPCNCKNAIQKYNKILDIQSINTIIVAFVFNCHYDSSWETNGLILQLKKSWNMRNNLNQY